MSRSEILQNLRAIVASLAKARPDEVAQIVGTLKARTRGRTEGADVSRFGAEVIITDLCDYPLDVVRDACDAWIDTEGGKWFPAWAELKLLCEARVRGRRALAKGLQWMLERTP